MSIFFKQQEYHDIKVENHLTKKRNHIHSDCAIEKRNIISNKTKFANHIDIIATLIDEKELSFEIEKLSLPSSRSFIEKHLTNSSQ